MMKTIVKSLLQVGGQQQGGRSVVWRRYSGIRAPGANKLLEEYTSLLASARLLPDPSQQSAVKALALLQDYACMSPQPRLSSASSDPSATPAPHAPAAEPSWRTSICGVYLHGPVGSGKTFLMDLFFRTLPLPTASTRIFEQATTNGQQPRPEAPQDSRGREPTGRPADSAGSAPASSPPPQPEPVAPKTPMQPPPQQQHQQQKQKQRLHFHEFMMSVHQRLHALHQARPRVLGRSRQGLPVYRYAEPEHDPLDQVVMEVAATTRVLCLDELHVTDVADAMILARILEGIMCLGTLVIFTSNRPPKDLYLGGLSRKYFEPFIALTEETMAVVRISSGRDYRAPARGPAVAGPSDAKNTGSPEDQQAGNEAAPFGSRQATGTVFVGPGSSKALQNAWLQATQGWVQSQPQVQAAFGRSLWIPALLQPPGQPAGAQAAYLRFSQICGDEGLAAPSSTVRTVLGPSDYVHLCRQVPNIYIEGVPKFSPGLRDEARRFVTLLDVLYEERCRLVCSTDCPPGELFLPLLAEAAQQDVNPNLGRSQKLDVQDILQHAAAGKPSASHILDRQKPSAMPRLPQSLLQEEVLMYHRAASRLQALCALCPP